MKTLSNINQTYKIPTNSSLDAILEGGIDKGTITQFYGPPASGKTNIALTLAIEVAKSGKKVIYVDTEGGLSIDRVKQIAHDYFDFVANNLIIFEPHTFKSQQGDLKSIYHWLKDNNEEVDLVIVDSIVALYRVTDKLHQDLNKDLGKQMAQLSSIATKFNIAVLITNQIYSLYDLEGNNSSITPIGGTILQYWSKIIIELSKSDVIGQRIATIKRHRTIAEGITTKFQITGDGIR